VKTPEQKRYFTENLDGVAKLLHPDGKPGIRHIVGIRDVVQAILLSVGNKAAIGEAFAVAGPAPFSYDVLAGYVAEKLSLPVVEFTESGFYDFQHSIAKGRSMLGYDPQYDIFRIVDDAIAFRTSGKKRRETKYPG
jgi:nucleoside-diphosphate-sugar epimerase